MLARCRRPGSCGPPRRIPSPASGCASRAGWRHAWAAGSCSRSGNPPAGARWPGSSPREDGRFRFVTRAGRSIATYRVLAPRTIVGGHTYAAMHTRRRRVAPVAQEGVLKMAATAGVGAATPVTARFTPTRPGRRVRLELRSAGKWARVASGREGARIDLVLGHAWPGRHVSLPGGRDGPPRGEVGCYARPCADRRPDSSAPDRGSSPA